MTHILFYDGVCGICNKTIPLVSQYDTKEEIYFSPLQTKFSEKLLKTKNLDNTDLDTFYFCKVNNVQNPVIEKHWNGYEAWYQIICLLSKTNLLLWLLSWILCLIPLFIIVPIYNFIGKRRYLILGKHDSICKKVPNSNRFIFDK
jgi:predicted DCC family thiol-disulfide oxidoreductase YuxK